MQLCSLLGDRNFFLEIFQQLKTKRNRWLEVELESDQVQAGSQNIENFGEFSTIDALAEGDVTKYDEILKIDTITIFTKLRFNMTVNKYQKSLYRIKERNIKRR